MGCDCKRKNKFLRIVEGWHNVTFPDPKIEEIAVKRSEICNGCDQVKWVCGIAVCKLCGCPLTAKCRSLSEECDLGKWGQEKVTTYV
jgi:hypothetical protein